MTVTVHRTTSLAALRMFHEDWTRRRNWLVDVTRWAERMRVHPDPVIGPDRRITGFQHPRALAVPTGWRYASTRSNSLLIPHLRTALGRRFARELGRLLPPVDVRPLLPDINCPALAVSPRHRMIGFQMELREQGSALYAVWEGRVPDAVASPPTWEPVDWADYQALVAAEQAA